jgi:hypothetical protein
MTKKGVTYDETVTAWVKNFVMSLSLLLQGV